MRIVSNGNSTLKNHPRLFAERSRGQIENIQRGEGEFYLHLERLVRIPAFIRKIAMRIPSLSIDLPKKH